MHYLFASIEGFEKFLKNEYSSELQARSEDLNNIVVYAFGKVLYRFEPIFIYCSEEKNLRSNCFRLSVAQLSKFKFIAGTSRQSNLQLNFLNLILHLLAIRSFSRVIQI